MTISLQTIYSHHTQQDINWFLENADQLDLIETPASFKKFEEEVQNLLIPFNTKKRKVILVRNAFNSIYPTFDHLRSLLEFCIPLGMIDHYVKGPSFYCIQLLMAPSFVAAMESVFIGALKDKIRAVYADHMHTIVKISKLKECFLKTNLRIVRILIDIKRKISLSIRLPEHQLVAQKVTNHIHKFALTIMSESRKIDAYSQSLDIFKIEEKHSY